VRCSRRTSPPSRPVRLRSGDSGPRCDYHGDGRISPWLEDLLTARSDFLADVPPAPMAPTYEAIRPRLEEVERLLLAEIAAGPPAVQESGGYVIQGGGKRLRPSLLLLVSRMLGFESRREIVYGAVVEMIHTATLVHDDIIDHASVRRGRTTANHRWGNQLTVLLGDWLFIRALELALGLGDTEVMRVLSRATVEMVEGEVLGLSLNGRVDVSRDQYLDIVRRKTAELFAACGAVPTLIGTDHRDLREPLAAFGLNLGMCFQIIDDLLDLTASETRLGKPVFSDLREGKVTLPFILLLPRVSAAHRAIVERAASSGEIADAEVAALRSLLRDTGVLSETRALAAEYAATASHALERLPDTPERDVLATIPSFVLQRDF
jgi:octaprenyl-diphosphate synthase